MRDWNLCHFYFEHASIEPKYEEVGTNASTVIILLLMLHHTPCGRASDYHNANNTSSAINSLLVVGVLAVEF